MLVAGDNKQPCSSGVEYLINNETVFSSTLYIPVNKSAAIGCRKCSGSGPPTWFDVNKKKIRKCDGSDADVFICSETNTDDEITYLHFIPFKKSLAGNYKCAGKFVWIDVLLG